MTIYTAIFGPYDELKQPLVITPGWKYICFTDQPFTSEVWEIRKVGAGYGVKGRRQMARRYKIRFNDYIDDDKSVWIDGSFTINCDLNEWWNSRFISPMTCISHPIRDCVFEEADACIRNHRGNAEEITTQVAKYRGIIPERGGLIQSGILMRERTQQTIELCRLWFNEVKAGSDRDQLAFAMVEPSLPVHRIQWDYRKGREFIFKTHIPRRR